MSPTCPSWVLFILFSFCTVFEAWVLNHAADEDPQDGAVVAPVELRPRWNHTAPIARRQEESLDCSDTWYSQFLQANPDPEIRRFCNEWFGIRPATVVVDVTPTMYAL